MKSGFTVRSVLVKFGTNRNPNCVDSVVQFGAERGTNLHLGVSSVEVGDIHQFGSHGRSWFAWANQMFRHVIQATQNSSIDVRSTSIISDPEAFGQFSRYLAESFEKPHHMLYVHGFNTNFDFALKQAGRLAADLKVSGNTFLFSWPSKGSLAQYSADEASVGACYPFFAEYLEIILRAIGDMSLTIIAHSMGNRLLTRWISDQGKVSIKPFIKNAILAAPDVDFDEFCSALVNHEFVCQRTTLYANPADLALQASAIKHSYHRAGLVPPLPTLPKLETVVVEGFPLDTLAHSYFAEAGNTLHDIFVMMQFDASLEGRPATRKRTINGVECWTLPYA